MTRPLNHGWSRVSELLISHPTTMSWLFVCAELAAAIAGQFVVLVLLMAGQLAVIMFVVNTFYSQAKKQQRTTDREGPPDDRTP